MFVVLGVVALAGLFCVYMLIRNEAVYRYRTRVADTVFAADVDDYKWRMNVMNTVGYGEMMQRFWVWPLDKFYPDKAFLDLSQSQTLTPVVRASLAAQERVM